MVENNDAGGNNDGGGSGAVEYPGWMASLPDAHKTNERFAAFKEAPAIWDKFDSLLQAEGKAITIPDEKATDMERAAFYTKLGRPETADKYSITKPSELPEDIPYSPEIETAFRQFAFEKGLSDTTTKDIYDWYWGLVKTGYEKQVKTDLEATEAGINTLKDQWKGDTFAINSELAKRAFKKFGGETPEIKDFIENTKVKGVALGNHPVFLKVFAAIGKSISEDSLNIGDRGVMGGELSDEEKAKARFPATYKK